MTKRSPFTLQGRERLRGNRPRVSPRGFPKVPEAVRIYYLPDGQPLNTWESKYAWALVDMRVNFIAQAQVGPVRALTGGLVDFLLPDHKIAIEIQGPFHAAAEGKVKDLYRRWVREYWGYSMVEVSQADLRNPHRHIKFVVGNPLQAIALSGNRRIMG